MTAKYKLIVTGECKKNLKLCKRRRLPMDLLWDIVEKLLCGVELDKKYNVHALHGNRKGQWECHILPNWLLIWEINDKELVLILVNTGTHSDLLEKNKKR
jgi:mRNA interferase YafQ